MKRILTLIALTILISINGWVNSAAVIVDWKPLTLNAQFGEGSYYGATTVQAGVMYIVGGNVNTDSVWKSTNGTTWKSVTKNANIDSARGTLVSLNNVLYLIGAADLVHATGGVWASSDLGVTWVDKGPFGFGAVNLLASSAVVYNDLIYIMGADADVWTYDGTTFSRITALSDYEASTYSVSMVYDGKIWRIGGYAGGAQWSKKIYNSTDGINWSEVINTLSLYPTFHKGLVYKGEMYIFQTSVAYTSVDGQTWSLLGAPLESVGYNIGQVNWLGCSVLNNKLLYYNGYDNTKALGMKEVWVGYEGVPDTATPTFTRTPFPTITKTYTPADTKTVTSTLTYTLTKTVTNTHTKTWTLTPTVTSTTEIFVSVTNTGTFTATPTLTFTSTLINTPSMTHTLTTEVVQTLTFTPTVGTPTVVATPMIWDISTDIRGGVNQSNSENIAFTKYLAIGSSYLLTVAGGGRTVNYTLVDSDNLDGSGDTRFLYKLPGLLWNETYNIGLTITNPSLFTTPLVAPTIVLTPGYTPTPNGWTGLPFSVNRVQGVWIPVQTPGVLPVQDVQLPTFFADVDTNTYVTRIKGTNGNYLEPYENSMPTVDFLHKLKEIGMLYEWTIGGNVTSTLGAHYEISVPSNITIAVIPDMSSTNGVVDLSLWDGSTFGSKGTTLNAVTNPQFPLATPPITIFANANTLTASGVYGAQVLNSGGSDTAQGNGTKSGGNVSLTDDWATLPQGNYHMSIFSTGEACKFRLNIKVYVEPTRTP